jgi:hypothetical protein
MRDTTLAPARALLDVPFGDPGSLCLALTYFESIWIYVTGERSNGRSKAFFRSAFVEVFRTTGVDPGLLGRVADVLYEDGRCGFFHDGLFRHRIFFHGKPGAVLEITVPRVNGSPDPNGTIQSVLIDAGAFLDQVERHFEELVARLRDAQNADVRSRFFVFCKELWDWDGEAVMVGLPG